MSLEELINEHYDQLNENDIHVLKYILNHKETCYDLAINDLADACHASRSSIHRMTKKLGFSGYSEFRVFLKWEEKQESDTSDSMEMLENDVAATQKNMQNVDFESLSNMLIEAGRIFIYGTGLAQLTCCREAQRLFAVKRTFVTVVYDETEFDAMMQDLNEEDIVIIVSLSGDTPTLMPRIKQLTARGVPFISITNLKNNTLAQMASFNIYATTTPVKSSFGSEIVSFIPFNIALETVVRHYADYLEKEK